MPTVTVVSDAFDLLARAEARSLGYPTLPLVRVPHPVATRPAEVLRAWGEELVAAVVTGLTRGMTS